MGLPHSLGAGHALHRRGEDLRLTRLYVPGRLAAAGETELPESAAAHVARVLRLRPGDPLLLFDGSGTEFRAELASVGGSRARVRVLGQVPGLAESPLRVTLVQAVSRSERMDWTLQKATELGVSRIRPVFSARSVVRLDGGQAERRLRHWEAVVASACEQCGRSVLPVVDAPVELARYLSEAPAAAVRLLLGPRGTETLASRAAGLEEVELLIGPEGGLDDTETGAALAAGYAAVRLGPRVLRTETAGIAALAVLQALAGDLR
jgi:16S rRNA (uracil1498-N3)-methyltransferase